MAIRTTLIQVEKRAAEVRTPGSRWPAVRRIVVSRHDRLGDLVLSLPAVDALRRAYPSARIGLLVQPRLRPLAEIVDGVDHVIEAVSNQWRLRGALRDFEADVLVSISRGAAIPWTAMLASVRHRVGPGYRFYSPLFERRVRERRRAGGRHEVEYALSFAHRCGAPAGPARFPIRVPGEVDQEVKGWLESGGVGKRFVALHPGTGGSCPAWPVEHYLELASSLRREGADVVLSVGPDDAGVARALDGAPEEVRGLPRFTGGLQQLAALVRRAAVVTTNSTGPLHLAAALGTPTLGFFAPWPTCGPGRWGPYADNGWALVAVDDRVRRWSRRRRRSSGPDLMRGIPPAVAESCVLDLLHGRTPA